MKSQTSATLRAEGVLQIQSPICAINFANNVGQAEHETTFKNS